MDQQVDEHQEMDTWKYYDAMPSPWTVPNYYSSLSSLLLLSLSLSLWPWFFGAECFGPCAHTPTHIR
uniref:Uncharacterized protein n=1 Tax=Arundo donax TaxID=35708 RepID=A0A0A9HCN4_ARUDO